ncbi:MAG: hypothetical protein U1F26_14730 [Lysobacterales bacterium]
MPLWEQALSTALAQWGEADTAVAIVRLGRAQTLIALNRADEARGELDRAVASYRALGASSRGGLARSLAERARVLLMLGSPTEACADVTAAEQALPDTRNAAAAYVQAVRADCQLAQGQPEAARQALTQALANLGEHAVSGFDAQYVRALRTRLD